MKALYALVYSATGGRTAVPLVKMLRNAHKDKVS